MAEKVPHPVFRSEPWATCGVCGGAYLMAGLAPFYTETQQPICIACMNKWALQRVRQMIDEKLGDGS